MAVRVSLSRRVFLVFFSLFLVTAVLGGLLLKGMYGLRAVSREISALQDFQLQVQRLESVSRQPGTDRRQERFQQEVAVALRTLVGLQFLRGDLPRPLRNQLGSMVEHLGYYREAFELLSQRQNDDAEFQRRALESLERIVHTVAAMPEPMQSDGWSLLTRLALELGNESAGGGPERVSRVRALAARMPQQGGDGPLQQFVSAVEHRYLNGLGIREQQIYLRDSEGRFQEVAGQTIAFLKKANAASRQRLTAVIAASIGLALALTLLLWIRSTRYLGRFLDQTRAVMQRVRAGDFTAEVGAAGNDELGDLTRFLAEVAGELGDSIARTAVSEEKYRRLVENMSEWVWEVDQGWRFTYSSPAVRGILGEEPDSVLGKPLHAVLGEASDEGGTRSTRSLTAGQLRVQEWRSEVPHRNGDLVSLETSWGPVRDDRGEIRGYRGITRDVSERRRADEQRQRLEEQLVQAQKMEAVGTLSGGVAHDFNNLLQSIGGYAELILHRNDLVESDQEAMRKIVAATERAAKLTQQLLLFSRRTESLCRSVDLSEEIRRCLDLLRHTIPKMIELRTDLDDNLPQVSVDPLQFEQVLMNLVLNARDAMPEGGVIRIATESIRHDPSLTRRQQSVPAGDYAVVTVSDDGKGMSPGTRQRIFEPFFTTKEVGKGTGLGLAMVYGIVKSHGGFIECASNEGEGTTFTLYQPVSSQGHAAQAEPRQVLPAPGASALGGSETILLVDDEELILDLGAEFLADAGYRVLTAPDGEGALEILQNGGGRVDLVLLDLNMPGMGGQECLERILRLNPHQKVVITSGYAESERRKEGSMPLARGWIHKPFRLQHLLREVRAVLEER